MTNLKIKSQDNFPILGEQMSVFAMLGKLQFSSFSRSVVSDSLPPRGKAARQASLG